MSAFGLARQLGIERGAAQILDLLPPLPGCEGLHGAHQSAGLHQQGYVETLFGRRLYLPNITARNQQVRSAAERTAINAPMQGTAADIIKRAMLAVDDWIHLERPPLNMLMQVHDELVFEVAPDGLDAASSKIRQLMESAAQLSVPLVVDIGVGDNWDKGAWSPRRTACMSNPAAVAAPVLVGMVLILLGMALIVLATRDVLMHGLGGIRCCRDCTGGA